MRELTISIDYDETWSADPGLWKAFARMARRRGHNVLLVTNRPNEEPYRMEVLIATRGCVDEVIFAGIAPKRHAAEQAGWDPDIWVDDLPHTVELGRILK